MINRILEAIGLAGAMFMGLFMILGVVIFMLLIGIFILDFGYVTFWPDIEPFITAHWQQIVIAIIAIIAACYIMPCFLIGTILALGVSGFAYVVTRFIYSSLNIEANYLGLLLMKTLHIKHGILAKIFSYPDALVLALLIQIPLSIYIWLRDRKYYIQDSGKYRERRIAELQKQNQEYIQTYDGKLIPTTAFGMKKDDNNKPFDPYDPNNNKPRRRKIGFI